MTGMMVGTCHGHRDLDDGEAQDVVYGPWALSLLPACLLRPPATSSPLPVPAIIPCPATEATCQVTGGHPRSRGFGTQLNLLYAL